MVLAPPFTIHWETRLQFVDLHKGGNTDWPLTARLTVQLSFPASLMIWQVYSPAWDLSTLKSSKITWLSFREKLQSRPARISFVPLNHFSLRGALPFTMAEIVTLEPGMASTGWGGTAKDGGSGRKQTATEIRHHGGIWVSNYLRAKEELSSEMNIFFSFISGHLRHKSPGQNGSTDSFCYSLCCSSSSADLMTTSAVVFTRLHRL